MLSIYAEYTQIIICAKNIFVSKKVNMTLVRFFFTLHIFYTYHEEAGDVQCSKGRNASNITVNNSGKP